MQSNRVVVVGAGVGGLTSALLLAARGCDVTVVERADHPGGKMREVLVGGSAIDAGPTVFTMRWVFDEILDSVGRNLDEFVKLAPVETLARHAWSDRGHLDLFADTARSADAIGKFAGAAEARGYLAFCTAARQTYVALERTFLTATQPSMTGLVDRLGFTGLRNFTHTNPMATMWSELGRYFADPRLRQLFGRYATYVGSSPFEAPSTLMLIAHVEQNGVWLVEGGMHRVAVALADIATSFGAKIRYGAHVSGITTNAGGAASGVVLATGERIDADAVVFNGDANALALGLAGQGASRALGAHARSARSLSAVTFAMRARSVGFPLIRHSVFFSRDYEREFADLFSAGRMPADPTVYICAQDRDDHGLVSAAPGEPERLFCLINAPANGGGRSGHPQQNWIEPEEMDRCRERMANRLAACGLALTTDPSTIVTTTPSGFEALFPGTGGAIYGMASHGWMASFKRPHSRTSMTGLYLAGGSVHPGAGVPMAALSGRLAADSVLQDLTSQSRSRRAATPGGMSTGSATTASTRSR